MKAFSLRLATPAGGMAWGQSASWVRDADVANIRFFSSEDAALLCIQQVGLHDERLEIVQWMRGPVALLVYS